MIPKSMVVIAKILLPIVLVLMSHLLCELIMHIINGGRNVTIRINTVPMFFLFFIAFKVILKVVRLMSVTSIKF